jgi:hypothetical protein
MSSLVGFGLEDLPLRDVCLALTIVFLASCRRPASAAVLALCHDQCLRFFHETFSKNEMSDAAAPWSLMHWMSDKGLDCQSLGR